MFKQILIGLTIVGLFSGCVQKNAFSVFGGDSSYQKGIDYTQVGDIVHSFETKAIINATYLNPVEPKVYNNKYQNFLIGIYISDDNENREERYINNQAYSLTLNDKAYESIEELDKKSELYNHLPLKNSYAKYYVVKFKKTEELKLILQYKHTSFGKVDLNFEAM